MLRLTKINDAIILLNPDNIEYIEATPDSIITFSSGKTMIIKESLDEIQNKFVTYKKQIHQSLQSKLS